MEMRNDILPEKSMAATYSYVDLLCLPIAFLPRRYYRNPNHNPHRNPNRNPNGKTSKFKLFLTVSTYHDTDGSLIRTPPNPSKPKHILHIMETISSDRNPSHGHMSFHDGSSSSHPSPYPPPNSRIPPHHRNTVHSFPPPHQLFSYASNTSSSKLSALHDDTSSFHSVSKAILYLTQSCAAPPPISISSSFLPEDPPPSSLHHIPRYYQSFLLPGLHALQHCGRHHQHRSCRILAWKGLAILARNGVAQWRSSTALFSHLTKDEEEEEEHHWEDECGHETGVLLAQSALLEEDDGIAAGCMEALSILVGSPLGKDAVWVEGQDILGDTECHPRFDDPLDYSLDYEEGSSMMEFQSNILENVIPSRIRRLVFRFQQFANTEYQMTSLPLFSTVFTYFLTATPSSSSYSIVQQSQCTYHQFAKRWYDMDFGRLAKDVLSQVLIPGMTESLHVGYMVTCALAALRMIDAGSKCHRGSLQEMEGVEVCQLAADILVQHALSSCSEDWKYGMGTLPRPTSISSSTISIEYSWIEQKCGSLSAAMIALRTIPLSERPEVLLGVLEGITSLPSIYYRGKHPCRSMQHRQLYQPIRIGLLTEVALNLLVDGVSSPSFPKERAETIKFMLMDPIVTLILQERWWWEDPSSGGNGDDKDLSDTPLSKPEQGHRAFFPDTPNDDATASATATATADSNHHSVPWNGTSQDQEELLGVYKGPPLAEELVYSFCTAACNIGLQLSTSSRGLQRQSLFNMEEWLQSSIIILAHFSSCLDWKSSSPDMEGDPSENDILNGGLSALSRQQMLPATKAYLSLLALTLFKVDLISLEVLSSLEFLLPSLSNVIAKESTSQSKTTRHDQNHPILPRRNDETSILGSHCQWATYELSVLCQQILEYKLLQPQVSPPTAVRIILLSLLSNHWNTCFSRTSGEAAPEASQGTLLMESSARELLLVLENEISYLIQIASSLDNHYSHNASADTSDLLNFFFLCTHAVEEMALQSIDAQEHGSDKEKDDYGTDLEMKNTFDEGDAYSIASLCLQALMGHAHAQHDNAKLSEKESIDRPSTSRNLSSSAEDGLRAKMMEECQVVFRRIQASMDKTSASEDGMLLIEELTKKKPEPFQTPPRHSRNFASSTPGAHPFMSVQSQKSTSSFMSGVSNTSHIFAPALLSPLHSLAPFKPTSSYLFLKGLFWHEARLLNLSRTTWALRDSPLGTTNIPVNQPGAGSTHASLTAGIGNSQSKVKEEHVQISSRPVIPRNPLRLPFFVRESTSQKIPESMRDVVQTISGSSDPVSITMAYGVRNGARYDGNHDRQVLVTVRITNVTPVPIEKGLRLELSVLNHVLIEKNNNLQCSDSNFTNGIIKSPLTKKILSTLNIARVEEVLCNHRSSACTSALFKAELLPYESLTWEVILDKWDAGSLELLLSTTFREVSAELPTHRMLSSTETSTEKKASEDSSLDLDESSKNTADTAPLDDEFVEDDVLDMTFSGNSVFIEPSIMLQSCPLVFYHPVNPASFRDRNGLNSHSTTQTKKLARNESSDKRIGDESVFWYLWKNLPRKSVHLTLSQRNNYQESTGMSIMEKGNLSFKNKTELSCLWVQDAKENASKRAWAFLTWCGIRILCLENNLILKNKVLPKNGSIERESNLREKASKKILEVRCDDVMTILSFVGSQSSRKFFIENLIGSGWECEETEEQT